MPKNRNLNISSSRRNFKNPRHISLSCNKGKLCTKNQELTTMFTQVGARQKFGEKTWFLDKTPGFQGTRDLLTQKNVFS